MNDQQTSKNMDSVPDEAEGRVSENEKLVNRAVGRHQGTLIPVVFNRKERQLVRDQLMAELDQGFRHRRQTLDLVLQTRLQSIQEACNHLLVKGKTDLRQQRTDYFSRVYKQVFHNLDQLSSAFLAEIDQRLQKLNTFQTDFIREREQKRLEKSVDDFLDTLAQLMDEFRHIVSENVEHEAVL
ncbi:MAG: hypothetical protein CR963_00025 [Gammaproteobacteria bacterium]|nr:MAG: hypothetical protein CR963_00025 [Gammaproteobacteria bacterium]